MQICHCLHILRALLGSPGGQGESTEDLEVDGAVSEGAHSDGADVLVRKDFGEPRFALEVVSSTVKCAHPRVHDVQEE